MRINLRLHVVDEIAALLRFLDRQFFVFCPAQRLGRDRGFPASRLLRARFLGKLLHHLAERIAGRQLGAFAVGRQHRGKQICGGEGNFSKARVRSRRLERQRVFQFVRHFAEFAVAAGGGIAFQGVHDPAQRPHNLGIAGMLLQLERFVVQRLEKFLRALKKELAQFRHAIVRLAHSFTSTR